MRVMGALTPDERLASRLEELTELRARVEGEMRRIKAAMRRTNPNGRPPSPRPPCNSEKGYQRHYREGEHCDPCMAAHRRHERARYAARKLAESPVEMGLSEPVDSATRETIEVHQMGRTPECANTQTRPWPELSRSSG